MDKSAFVILATDDVYVYPQTEEPGCQLLTILRTNIQTRKQPYKFNAVLRSWSQ